MAAIVSSNIYIVKFWLCPLPGPIIFIFMQFSKILPKIIGWHPSPFGVGVPSEKSWIRYWYRYRNMGVTKLSVTHVKRYGRGYVKVLRIFGVFFRHEIEVLLRKITDAFVQSGHTGGGVSRCQINLHIQTSGSNGCVHFVVVQIHSRPHWIWYKFRWMEENVSLTKLFDSSIRWF